jgi:hypothetical protein
VYRRFLAVLLAALMPTSALAVGPAQADTHGYPVILAPSGDVPSGFTGPVTIDFTDVEWDDFELEVICDGGYYHYDEFWFDGAYGNRESFDLYDPIRGPTNCQIKLTSDQTGKNATGYFTVAAPPPSPLAFDTVTVAPATFYPLVDDGYRDTTTVTYRLNQEADVDVKVTTAAGSLVRSDHLGRQSGSRSWAWDGKRSDGGNVRPGDYFITLKAIRNDGATVSVSRLRRRAQR